jgi:CHAD domain-containing protein
MSGGKWIQDLTATTPLEDAARRVLTVRLEVVRDYLPLAVREPYRDPEHVHQLRVGTRRARAALDIFASCLPAKVHKTARKLLRRIRRAAGEARDWDVFLAGLTEWGRQQKGRVRPGVNCLLGYAVARREVAQAQLDEAGKDYPFSFDRFLAETVAAVHKPHDPDLHTLRDLAQPLLTGLLKELDEAGNRNMDDYEHLHRVRILGKQLRYAMEVFADCFAPAFRDQLYPAVEEMQEILGHANDSYVACRRLETLSARLQALAPAEWKRLRPGVMALRDHHQDRLPRERQCFLDWWANWLQSGGEAAFFAILKSPQDQPAAEVAPPRVENAQDPTVVEVPPPLPPPEPSDEQRHDGDQSSWAK